MSDRLFRSILGLFLLAVSLCPITHAQILDYGAYSGFGLGKGILGNDYVNPLPACVTGNGSKLPASHQNVHANLVYNADQYSRVFHIDQTAHASFLNLFGGGDELHLGQQDDRSSRAFDIIIEAFTERDSDTLNGITYIDPDNAAKMASGDPVKIESVRQLCGDRFIQTVFNEARLYVVMHVSSRQSSSLLQYSGKVNASFNIGIASLGGDLGGDNNIKSANQSGAISIDVYSEGIDGFAASAAALGLSNSDGLQSIADKMQNILRQQTITAQPVKYQLAPMKGFGSNDLGSDLISTELGDLRDSYWALHPRLDNIRALLNDSIPDPRRFLFANPNQAKTDLRKQELALLRYLTNVSDAHTKCRKAAQASICIDASAAVSDPPPSLKVELPPVTPPNWAPFIVQIDGALIDGRTALKLFTRTGSTLLAEAQRMKPGATSVNLIAPIDSPYLGSVDFPLLSQQSAVTPVEYDKFATIYPQSFSRVLNGVAGSDSFTALVLIHADSSTPCPISNLTGVGPVLDESCLTDAGKYLKDFFLAEGAKKAVSAPTQSLRLPIAAIWHDCWGGSGQVFPPAGSFGMFPIVLGDVDSETSVFLGPSGPVIREQVIINAYMMTNDAPGVATLLLPGQTLAPSLTPTVRIALKPEIYPATDWIGISQNRYDMLTSLPRPAGSTNCSATIQ